MIIGERVRLRAMERADLPTFVRWFNDPEVRAGLAMFAPMSLADEERWFDSRSDRGDYLFCIEARVGLDWVLIGNVGLHRIDWVHRAATFGIAIGEKEHWNQGLGTAATRLICAWGFDTLNLHRIELCVYDYNPRARRCYEKVGFRHEGTARQAHWHDGGWHDVHHFGLLREDLTVED